MGEEAGVGRGQPPAVLDQSRLDDLRDIDPGLAAEVAAVWLDTAPTMLDRLAAALVSGDEGGLAAAAHALRGSSANVGAAALADACGDLERAGRAGAPVDAAFAAIEREHVRAMAALALVAAEHPAPASPGQPHPARRPPRPSE